MKKAPGLLWVPIGIVFCLVVEILVFIPIALVGLIAVPIATLWAKKQYIPSRLDPSRRIWAYSNPTLNELFGNHEDGIEATVDGTLYGPFAWFVRNPVCNMRFWPVVSTFPSRDVQWVGNVSGVPPDGTPGWFVAWQGPYVGFLFQTTKTKTWMGWKVNPRDARPDAPKDYRYAGLGLACQPLHRF